ncbi:hypothetical protein KFL_003710050 [Klebsormidium nitens]|uniref:GATA-type domain-containing protein n=1 Tax=Klebsormidium nitens TaxID=105231 RepID=A0A1Y1IE57_KLENI|nr:hypothetical protein KFL_003710050 [Klebsormidium nitens]|eukprot:GAQ87699.1 hypothetical protein KFL_003710050 [Klebsormidium nitens]
MVAALTNECSVYKERKSRRWFVCQEDNESPLICKTCNATDAKRKSEPPPPLMCTIVQKGGKTIGYARPNPEATIKRSAAIFRASQDEAQGVIETTSISPTAENLGKTSVKLKDSAPEENASAPEKVAALGGQQEGSAVPMDLPSSAGQESEQHRGEEAGAVQRGGVLAPAGVQEWDLRTAAMSSMTLDGEHFGAKHAKRKTAVEAEVEVEAPEKKRSLREIHKRSAKRGPDPTPDSALAAEHSEEECDVDIEGAADAVGQQCVGCGVTESRRWYGGGNTCSKCYNREYERNRRARSGGNSAEGSVPHNEGPTVAALEPSPNQGLQKETESSEPTGDLKRKRGRPPVGAPKSSGKKEVAAEAYEPGRCADCGTRRKTPQWHAGAGGAKTQCQKCHDQGPGGVSKEDGPSPNAAGGKIPSPEMKAAPEKVPGEGIPLTGALVSRRVEVWCPIDNRFNAGRVVRFTNYNKWHQVRYDDGTKEVLNLAKERWKLLPRNHENGDEKQRTSEKKGPEQDEGPEEKGASGEVAMRGGDADGEDSGVDSSLPISNWAKHAIGTSKLNAKRKKAQRKEAAADAPGKSGRREVGGPATRFGSGGVNAKEGGAGGVLAAESGPPCFGKAPAMLGEVLELVFEKERREGAANELEGGPEGLRKPSGGGLQMSGDKTARSGAGEWASGAAVGAGQGDTVPEDASHEQDPSRGLASGRVAPTIPPSELPDRKVADGPLPQDAGRGRSSEVVEEKPGVTADTPTAAAGGDGPPSTNAVDDSLKAQPKPSDVKDLQSDGLRTATAEPKGARADETQIEDLRSEEAELDERQKGGVAEGPRGSSRKRCASCGVTKSRRWYGASAGTRKCSKCYDRDHGSKNKARKGSGGEKKNVPGDEEGGSGGLTKSRKRQRKDGLTAGEAKTAGAAVGGAEVQPGGVTKKGRKAGITDGVKREEEEETEGAAEEEEVVTKGGAKRGRREKSRDGVRGETAEGAQGAIDGGAKADADIKVPKAGNKIRSGKGTDLGEEQGTEGAAKRGEAVEVAGTFQGQMSSKKGSDAEGGSAPVLGTEPGDPPAGQGLQGFVGKVSEGLFEAGKERVAKADWGERREGADNGASDAGTGTDGHAADADREGVVKGMAGVSRKESFYKGLESAHGSPVLSPPIKATNRHSTAGTNSTPSTEAAAPKEDLRSAQPGSKALAENEPGDSDPLAREKKRSSTEKPSGQPSAEEAGGAIREGEGKLVARKKALGLAAKSTEVAGKGDPAGGVSVKAAGVESARTEEESASAALRGGTVKPVGKGAGLDVGKGSDVNAGLDADGTKEGRADGLNEGEGDVASDQSADTPTKKDLLAAIERELQERERVVEASTLLGGSPAEKPPKHSSMPQPAVLHLENETASLISGGPDVPPRAADVAAGAADATGRSGADHSEERVPAANGTAMTSPIAQPELGSKERTDVGQRGEGLESGAADVTAEGCADGTQGDNGPDRKEDNNGGEQGHNSGENGAQGQQIRGSQDLRETSGGEAPRPTIQGDQAGPSQQAARDKLSEPESGGPSEERAGGVSSASPGVLQERPGTIPEPWAEIVGALRGLIRVTEDSGRVVAARLDTLLEALEPAQGGGTRQGAQTTRAAAFEAGAPSTGPSLGEATPPESPGQVPEAAARGGEVSKGRSEESGWGQCSARKVLRMVAGSQLDQASAEFELL